MKQIRDFSSLSDPLYDRLDISLSEFHKDFLDSVDNKKISTNPTTKLLHYTYEENSYDYPNDIYEMMKRIPNSYNKGSPEYKFIDIMENNKLGSKRKAKTCIYYLRLCNFAGKPQETAGGGSRVDFFKYLKSKFTTVPTIDMYHSNIRKAGDKHTLAYCINNGIVSEDSCNFDILSDLHENQSIDFESNRVRKKNNEDTKNKSDEHNKSDSILSINSDVSDKIVMKINSKRVVGETESEVFSLGSDKITNQDSIENIQISTKKRISYEELPNSTYVSYGSYTVTRPNAKECLIYISKQLESNNIVDVVNNKIKKDEDTKNENDKNKSDSTVDELEDNDFI